MYWLLFEKADVLAFSSSSGNSSLSLKTENNKFITILQPKSESWTIENSAVWLLSSELTRITAKSKIQIEIYLDDTQLLHGDASIVTLPAPTTDSRFGHDPFRLSYDFGHIPQGLHNLTILVASLEKPPRFAPPYKNSSFFAKYDPHP
mmetsp:Transcript_24050/g.30098  ORF Transcript_24050/g.30098 Transcript_24050/m.30098 type:complete len:148 (-) Transcript_24050:51-494(-)